MLNKISLSAVLSLAFFLLGLVIANVLSESVDFWQLDEHRWKLIAPIVFPTIGSILGIVAIFKARRYFKLLALLLVLTNLGLAALIFVDYAFSYWEF